MAKITLQANEQIFTIKDDRKVVCVALEINGEYTTCFSYSGAERHYKTKELGCVNLETEHESPITEYEFSDLY